MQVELTDLVFAVSTLVALTPTASGGRGADGTGGGRCSEWNGGPALASSSRACHAKSVTTSAVSQGVCPLTTSRSSSEQ